MTLQVSPMYAKIRRRTQSVQPPAEIAGQCVAPPPTDLVPEPLTGNPVPRGYRGWDHMNCPHPTPPPPGWHHCPGENGCPILLQAGHRYCRTHADLIHDHSPADRARPQMALAAKRGHINWGRP
jgi:hypothetical protein